MKPMPRELALVVPVFNEAASLSRTLPAILARVRSDAPGCHVRMIAVDDGSADSTRAELGRLGAAEPCIQFVSFTRNFGKEAAILAGLRLALERTSAEAVVVLDADLQHPPELVTRMLQHWREGFLVAEGVKRSRPQGEGGIRRLAASLFYSAFSRLAGLRLDQDTDFKLLDREVVLAILALGERARFFRGIVRWLGHAAARVEFDVPQRAGGSTGWTLAALAGYAWRNLTAYSSAPLRMVTLAGSIGLAVGAVLGAKALVDKFNGQALDGFSTVILLQVIFSSLILISLGIIGSYIARIYDELKARPHYVLRPEDSKPRDLQAP